jgi:hypothetical protein
MGEVPVQDPGPGKTKLTSGIVAAITSKPRKGKKERMVPSSTGRHHRSVLGVVKRAKGAQTDKKGFISESPPASGWKDSSMLHLTSI